jgi:hypothetical protein
MEKQTWKDSRGTIYIAEIHEDNVRWHQKEKPFQNGVDSKVVFARRSKYWELMEVNKEEKV